MQDDATTSFGYRDIDVGAKQGLVDDVFHRVAGRYDIMNDLMSGGLHRLWKDAMVSRLAPPRSGRRPFEALDVAGGTGDVAFRIVERSGGRARAVVCDINASMLQVGRERAEKRGVSTVTFTEGNAEDLPFEDGRFDAYTIAFGIRNVPRIDKALSEAYRVLRPGGRFLCLEFSTVDTPVIDRLYDLYSFQVIPRLGRVVARDEDSYRYLVESIRRFPNPERFKAMIEAAGFKRVSVTAMTMGVAVLHVGVKI
ncbi:MAG TPA: bifunctional demethylmenaquinone methyltransferase/2-methoxy-6-polyprenyl-1,4-benzoquinol methylase UbiE [Methylomirabilota bacterium]|nr:bifunctional demethylmenaquinone methyltransferase/2-methoxy-6-polyprenyl-1,4-benzoquinol methylase UbiE [Methylomirabilota bacterium]